MTKDGKYCRPPATATERSPTVGVKSRRCSVSISLTIFSTSDLHIQSSVVSVLALRVGTCHGTSDAWGKGKQTSAFADAMNINEPSTALGQWRFFILLFLQLVCFELLPCRVSSSPYATSPPLTTPPLHLPAENVTDRGFQPCGNPYHSDAQWPWEKQEPFLLLVEFKGEPLPQKRAKGHHWATETTFLRAATAHASLRLPRSHCCQAAHIPAEHLDQAFPSGTGFGYPAPLGCVNQKSEPSRIATISKPILFWLQFLQELLVRTKFSKLVYLGNRGYKPTALHGLFWGACPGCVGNSSDRRSSLFMHIMMPC